MMPHGDKCGFSGEQAQGGHQEQTTHDLISNLQYTAINSKLTRQPVAYCFNNQKGNFDRIRLNLNLVASRCMGMPRNATLTHSKTLCNMAHTVRTSNGYSTNKILPDPQMGGIGQGSGGGPPCNHVQTIPMINTLGKLTQGCTMFDPTRKRRNKQHVVGWVDDNTNKESK